MALVNGVLMLIGAETVLHSINTFRSVWVRGRYGGGKTFISFLLAEHLQVRFGYSVFSNVENVFQVGDSVADNHAVVVYDEAWITLGLGASPAQIKRYLAFLRKKDYVLIMPSVLPIAKGGWLLWIERRFNFGPVGLPLWVYHWGISGKSSKESGGIFYVWMPQKHFGMYDTLAQPDEMEGLFDVRTSSGPNGQTKK
jgi:hypothetical protein